jgi:hypothetical protein
LGRRGDHPLQRRDEKLVGDAAWPGIELVALIEDEHADPTRELWKVPQHVDELLRCHDQDRVPTN